MSFRVDLRNLSQFPYSNKRVKRGKNITFKLALYTANVACRSTKQIRMKTKVSLRSVVLAVKKGFTKNAKKSMFLFFGMKRKQASGDVHCRAGDTGGGRGAMAPAPTFLQSKKIEKKVFTDNYSLNKIYLFSTCAHYVR